MLWYVETSAWNGTSSIYSISQRQSRLTPPVPVNVFNILPVTINIEQKRAVLMNLHYVILKRYESGL